MKRLVTATAIALVLGISSADAASFTCGKVMCALTGISAAQCKKLGLPLALNWARKFSAVASAVPGVVVVQSRRGMDASGKRRGGHVSKIVALTEKPCVAVVVDNRGKPYERNVCRNRVALVSPRGMWTE